MLIDETDALMAADREMAQALRGLMNSGFTRDFATFTMNVPTRDNGYEPREFSTWTTLALAGAGRAVAEQARTAAVALSGDGLESSRDEDADVMLLSDIRAVFTANTRPRGFRARS